MTRHNLGALAQWRPMIPGELYFFGVPTGGYRNVEFDVISDGYCTLSALTDSEVWLLCHGIGYQELRFTIGEDTSVNVQVDEGTQVYWRTRIGTQVVEESGEISFTSIEPRQPRVSSEVERMMQIMKLNQKFREKQLQEQINALQQDRKPEAAKPPTLQERTKKRAPAVAPDPDNGVGDVEEDEPVTE